MSEIVVHKAGSRGHANHGWLDTYHTFSFADYYDPQRVHFGALRVLNDDTVTGGMGFGTHPHDNMEIISIPLSGDLEHRDSMGNVAVIKQGDVQVMSAGTGILHSEKNKNSDSPVKFLQIWIFPNKRNVKPRYDQITLNIEDRRNKLQQILSPVANGSAVWIYQDAWFHMTNLEQGKQVKYDLKKAGNGIYVFVLEGEVNIKDQKLERRDGMEITGVSELLISATSDSELLLMEVPMTF